MRKEKKHNDDIEVIDDNEKTKKEKHTFKNILLFQ